MSFKDRQDEAMSHLPPLDVIIADKVKHESHGCRKGLELICAERLRQVYEEGFLSVRDDAYTMGELTFAAIHYAMPKDKSHLIYQLGIDDTDDIYFPVDWDRSWDKQAKHDRVRQLSIAGALIAAEIDRLLRLEETTNT